MLSKVDIRALNPHDAALYRELRLLGLQESPTSFGSSYTQEVNRTLEELIPRVTPSADGGYCVFGAFTEGRLIGQLAFVRISAEKLMHGAELAGMYVRPDFRGHGVGGALLDAVIAHATNLPGMRQLKLSVNANNAGARLLYRSRGFKCWGVEPDALRVDGVFYDEEYYTLRLPGIA